jgi:hypothetical protein
MYRDYKIENVRGHYEVIDDLGRIVVSGDTEHEALTEYGLWLADQYKQHRNIA